MKLKKILKNIWAFAQCCLVWGGFIMICEHLGWWWFDDAMRAACWKNGIYSGGGPGPVWLYAFWGPVVILFALTEFRGWTVRSEDEPKRTAAENKSL